MSWSYWVKCDMVELGDLLVDDFHKWLCVGANDTKVCWLTGGIISEAFYDKKYYVKDILEMPGRRLYRNGKLIGSFVEVGK